MNYNNWNGGRRGGRGRARGRRNWNWRARGYNRIPMNLVMQNIHQPGYNQSYQVHHDGPGYYQYKPFLSPPHHKHSPPPKPPSPLPGTEEYTQRNIQQTSELIKRQLNIDGETCSAGDDNASAATIVPSETCETDIKSESVSKSNSADSSNRVGEAKKNSAAMQQATKQKTKSVGYIDVQEIYDKIVKHISNLSYSKKINLVNQSSVGYDIAMQQVQKQKRLELSRALRDMSKRQTQNSDDGEVINAIIPDIGIKIEDFPKEIIAELSSTLHCDAEEHVNSLVDPEACFKQAQAILSVNFDNDFTCDREFDQSESQSNYKSYAGIDTFSNPFDFEYLNKPPDTEFNHQLESTSANFSAYTNTTQPFKEDMNYASDVQNIQEFRNPVVPSPSPSLPSSSFTKKDSSGLLDGVKKSELKQEEPIEDFTSDIDFCIKNLDVRKSYLTSFSATKPFNIQDTAETSASELLKLPHIKVRTDLLMKASASHFRQNLTRKQNASKGASALSSPGMSEQAEKDEKSGVTGDVSHPEIIAAVTPPSDPSVSAGKTKFAEENLFNTEMKEKLPVKLESNASVTAASVNVSCESKAKSKASGQKVPKSKEKQKTRSAQEEKLPKQNLGTGTSLSTQSDHHGSISSPGKGLGLYPTALIDFKTEKDEKQMLSLSVPLQQLAVAEIKTDTCASPLRNDGQSQKHPEHSDRHKLEVQKKSLNDGVKTDKPAIEPNKIAEPVNTADKDATDANRSKVKPVKTKNLNQLCDKNPKNSQCSVDSRQKLEEVCKSADKKEVREETSTVMLVEGKQQKQLTIVKGQEKDLTLLPGNKMAFSDDLKCKSDLISVCETVIEATISSASKVEENKTELQYEKQDVLPESCSSTDPKQSDQKHSENSLSDTIDRTAFDDVSAETELDPKCISENINQLNNENVSVASESNQPALLLMKTQIAQNPATNTASEEKMEAQESPTSTKTEKQSKPTSELPETSDNSLENEVPNLKLATAESEQGSNRKTAAASESNVQEEEKKGGDADLGFPMLPESNLQFPQTDGQQKRWKSPGEKKMMADVAGLLVRPTIPDDSDYISSLANPLHIEIDSPKDSAGENLTGSEGKRLEETEVNDEARDVVKKSILEQMEEFNRSMMSISTPTESSRDKEIEAEDLLLQEENRAESPVDSVAGEKNMPLTSNSTDSLLLTDCKESTSTGGDTDARVLKLGVETNEDVKSERETIKDGKRKRSRSKSKEKNQEEHENRRECGGNKKTGPKSKEKLPDLLADKHVTLSTSSQIDAELNEKDASCSNDANITEQNDTSLKAVGRETETVKSKTEDAFSKEKLKDARKEMKKEAVEIDKVETKKQKVKARKDVPERRSGSKEKQVAVRGKSKEKHVDVRKSESAPEKEADLVKSRHKDVKVGVAGKERSRSKSKEKQRGGSRSKESHNKPGDQQKAVKQEPKEKPKDSHEIGGKISHKKIKTPAEKKETVNLKVTSTAGTQTDFVEQIPGRKGKTERIKTKSTASQSESVEFQNKEVQVHKPAEKVKTKTSGTQSEHVTSHNKDVQVSCSHKTIEIQTESAEVVLERVNIVKAHEAAKTKKERRTYAVRRLKEIDSEIGLLLKVKQTLYEELVWESEEETGSGLVEKTLEGSEQVESVLGMKQLVLQIEDVHQSKSTRRSRKRGIVEDAVQLVGANCKRRRRRKSPEDKAILQEEEEEVPSGDVAETVDSAAGGEAAPFEGTSANRKDRKRRKLDEEKGAEKRGPLNIKISLKNLKASPYRNELETDENTGRFARKVNSKDEETQPKQKHLRRSRENVESEEAEETREVGELKETKKDVKSRENREGKLKGGKTKEMEHKATKDDGDKAEASFVRTPPEIETQNLSVVLEKPLQLEIKADAETSIPKIKLPVKRSRQPRKAASEMDDVDSLNLVAGKFSKELREVLPDKDESVRNEDCDNHSATGRRKREPRSRGRRKTGGDLLVDDLTKPVSGESAFDGKIFKCIVVLKRYNIDELERLKQTVNAKDEFGLQKKDVEGNQGLLLLGDVSNVSADIAQDVSEVNDRLGEKSPIGGDLVCSVSASPVTNASTSGTSKSGQMSPVTSLALDESTQMQEESALDSNVQKTEHSLEFKDFSGSVLVLKVVDTTILAGTDSGRLYYYSLQNGQLLHSLNLSKKPLTCLCVQKKNDKLLVYAGSLNGKIRIFDFDTTKVVETVKLDEGVQSMDVSWGYLFIGSHKGQLVRYDVKKEKVENTVRIYDSNIFAIRATQEGARKVLLVAARGDNVSVRDAMTGLLMRKMESPFCPTVYAIQLEKSLVYCGTSQHDILVYTFQDGQLALKHEATDSKGVVCIQIVGNLLFAGCYNGNVYVYNTATNVYVGRMDGPGGMLLAMEVVGDQIIVGTKSNKLKSWKIPSNFLDQLL